MLFVVTARSNGKRGLPIAKETISELDRRTLHFKVETSETLRKGDALLIRNVQTTESGIQVSAISERAIRDETAKLVSEE